MTHSLNDLTLLTPGQVAERVQVSTKTVMRAIARRELRAAQIGIRGAWRISPDDIGEWLESRANRPRARSVTPMTPVAVHEPIPHRSRQRARPGRLELADL